MAVTIMYVLSMLALAILGSADADGLFYAFSANGLDIINPKTLSIVKRLPSNTTIPGTDQILCTKSPRSNTPCGWGGAVTVKGKYVFAADSYGSRVIVIDIQRQVPIKSVRTHGFPYDLTYIAALDEVWIHCWRGSYLDVVGKNKRQTAIQTIRSASSLKIAYTVKAQLADTQRTMMHGYLRAENCQNINPYLQYGVVTHFSEPGIHKIDLVNKKYDKFINMTAYGCKSTFGLAYSSVTQYAFVQCLGFLRGHKHRQMLVVDITNGAVVHSNDFITDKATGYPYASPDGKYVLVINEKQIISYHMDHNKNGKKRITRLKNVILPNFMPSRVAFVRNGLGFNAFVTSKNTEKILVLAYREGKIREDSVVRNVGKAANVTPAKLLMYRSRHLPSFNALMKKKNQPFSEDIFMKYLYKIVLTHTTRPISTGCGLNARYIASPAALENKVAIVDGKMKTLVGLISGVVKARDLLWVE